MKIIDINTLNYIFNHDLKIKEVHYLAPDIKEESEVTEQVFGRKLSENIKNISSEPIFNEGIYLKNYREMLNKYRGRSFYNMTGFGDISILALLKTLKECYQNQPRKLFKNMEEELVVITEDEALKKKIEKEFNQSNIDVLWKVKILDNSSVT